MERVGIEPTWPDFQSGALTNFATSPKGYQYVKELHKDKTKNPNLVSSGVYFLSKLMSYLWTPELEFAIKYHLATCWSAI